ncbi:hypothetical protein A2797_00655 [candidate division WWE3 bacterium RIFCSPHIGHO2_01_FULL_48_15]|uniref:5'-3' exonuclease domain-containing protein n=1 Tax=candidate division WWE3 bacterium RIFCSPHIGHO2_01_FULL_48_15 TaxID=1802619 RepID=A0A1F4VC51_UNCKA|nr:MAG: hypothetical protein A2797_00655 [candidate division WWE3 bacterium RIFCSPHIGHO2_01_FULL_48_15]
MNRLVLIDTQNFFHRAFYAFPMSFTTPDGESINAVYGFATMLHALVQELKPTHLACADESEKELIFRQVEFPAYKATRVPKPPEEQALFDAQIPKLTEFLGTAHIPRLTSESYEADDLIGTIVRRIPTDTEAYITSNDRDLMQLISPSASLGATLSKVERVGGTVRFYLPNIGKTGGKIYGDKEFFEEYGFKPPQMIEYKALRGDPSDNISGVRGIGEKTAADLVCKYGTLEEIYKHLLDLKPAVAQKLNEGRDDAFLSRKLVTIVTDAPVEFEMEDLRFRGLSQPEVLALFERWGFKSLLKKISDQRSQNSNQAALPI